MAKAATPRDMLWGYIAQSLNIGAGLILLPIILHYFNSEDVGLWFVFITLASLAQLLEFGFQPTLARNTAYVYAGAQSLNKHGLPSQYEPAGQLNILLLADLVKASRTIYRIVAALAAIVLLGLGSFYISTLLTPKQSTISSLLAWVFFASGYVSSFYFGYYNGLLQGRGDITAANKIVAATRGGLVLFGAAAVIAGWGLLGLGVASLLSSVGGRLMAWRYFNASMPHELAMAIAAPSKDGLLIRTLWHNASRLGAVQIGAFLVQRGNILIASSFIGLTAAASYGMTITILMTLMTVALVINQVQMPHMYALQAEGKRSQLKSVYGESLIIGWLVYLIGFSVIGLWGHLLLEIIGSKTEILPVEQLLILGLIFLLELNHIVAANYLTTANYIPFISASIWSGIATMILSLTLIKPIEIWGLIAAQGLVQLAYNNWKWPIEAVRHLGSKITEILSDGSLRIVKHFKK